MTIYEFYLLSGYTFQSYYASFYYSRFKLLRNWKKRKNTKHSSKNNQNEFLSSLIWLYVDTGKKQNSKKNKQIQKKNGYVDYVFFID